MLHREGIAKWEYDEFSVGYSITMVQSAARPLKHIICMQLHWGVCECVWAHTYTALTYTYTSAHVHTQTHTCTNKRVREYTRKKQLMP